MSESGPKWLRAISRLWSGTPARAGRLPSTFDPAPDGGLQRPKLFDPAMRHFRDGFRLGEPAFDDPEVKRRWQLAQRRAMDHLLRIAVESPWSEHLVLRGSLVLRAWLGEQAREPGDIDWVIYPSKLTMRSPVSTQLLPGLLERAGEQSRIADDSEILVDQIATDDIWTYERAGRRIVFPFRSGDLPTGVVQMDFVFGEAMPVPPVETAIPLADGGTINVLTASKELSLAWKILWLLSDSYPQGKDLYDAVLLAEQTRVSYTLLAEVLHSAGPKPDYTTRLNADEIANLDVEWNDFKAEYPQVAGSSVDWRERLIAALGPTFAQRPGS